MTYRAPVDHSSVRPRPRQDQAFLKELGKRMAALRRSRGFTQVALSNRVHLSAEFISRLENGRENPTALTMRSLAQGLGCRLAEFVQEDAREA